jgi:aminoglycoside phosphotransferase (APT) family kinase protein
MDPIDRPNDDFRERLTLNHIHNICKHNNLPTPTTVVPEPRGNEKVIYHLDDKFTLQFLVEQRDVDPLHLLSHIDEMPTPEVLAWCENDPTIDGAYLITTKCKGDRFDLLWHDADENQRVGMLHCLGEGWSRYHSLSPDAVTEKAERLGFSQLVGDDRATKSTWLEQRRDRTIAAIPSIEAFLKQVAERPAELISAIQEHLQSTELPSLAPSGLTHSEPWAEHYILEATDDRYVLTGCVDVERLCIADPAHEFAVMAASVLAHEKRWLDAFAAGYRIHRELPDDLEQRIHNLAIDHDLWSLSSSAGKAEWIDGELLDGGEPPRHWRIHCATGHARRLRKWLGLDTDFNESLFRAEIGPW